MANGLFPKKSIDNLLQQAEREGTVGLHRTLSAGNLDKLRLNTLARLLLFHSSSLRSLVLLPGCAMLNSLR